REHDLDSRHRRRVYRIAVAIAASLAVALFVAVTVSGLALQSARDEARQERDRLSQVLLDEAANTTEAELEILFKPVHGALLATIAWAEVGELDNDDPRELNPRVMPLLGSLDAATSMLRADRAGYEYMLLRTDSGWRTRSTTPGGKRPRLDEWTNGGELLRTSSYDRAYNPHSRPWYTGGNKLRGQAEQARLGNNPHPVHWTEPYKFF